MAVDEIPHNKSYDNDSEILKALEVISLCPKGSSASLSNFFGPSKAFILACQFKESPGQQLVVLSSDEKAQKFYEELKSLIPPNVHYYPSIDPALFSAPLISPELRTRRFEFLKNLATDKKDVFVLSVEALVEKIVPKDFFKENFIKLNLNEEYPRDDFSRRVFNMGYQSKPMVEEIGEVSIRGDIIDIFPPSFDHPLRLEFYGDYLETIKEFDELTQRTLNNLNESMLLSATRIDLSVESIDSAAEKFLERVEELGIERADWEDAYDLIREGREPVKLDHLYPFFFDELSSVADYLLEDSLVSFIDRESSEKKYFDYLSELRSEFKTLDDFKDVGDYFFTLNEAEEKLLSHSVINFVYDGAGNFSAPVKLKNDLREKIVDAKSLEPLLKEIGELKEKKYSIVISAHSDSQSVRIEELLNDYHIDAARMDGADFCDGYLSEAGLTTEKVIVLRAILEGTVDIFDALRPLAIISEEDIFGKRSYRRAAPSTKRIDAFLNQLEDLNEGDYIVHSLHGIGAYKGLIHMEVDGVENDFIVLEYADNDKLYIPVQSLDMVSKYKGPDSSRPIVEKLGSGNWEKQKKKVKKAVQSIAGELIKIYGVRLNADGFQFKESPHEYKEFEASFEFDETPDQLRAINEVVSDMTSKKVTDRLVCGDVGFGKTEVAMRAAFVAAMSSKQTAILVPTTVLAQQHFGSFKKRFKEFPVNIGILSRFRTKAQIEETIQGLKDGSVDIVIGTHRLLQKDITFKDLGLIIIDEEHRFGVSHKERLKTYKGKVDVLTLTATPIPRTLQMAFSDIRDLSIITTPPQDRQAITTRVVSFDDELIKEAILRELSRGGQVFFVHNRIDSIGAVKERLLSLIPSLKVAVGHGRLTGTELENVMVGFVNGDYDVLLATSIIESGLDIPRANTIIIDRADRFGLSDLYQLRGRVGRSYVKAYAYLITPDEVSLSKDALKRIEVMKELSELGSGFRLATYDLEIRGAGELLGAKQSGNMAAVGFDTYVAILEETVRELKGEKKIDLKEAEINIKISNYIPDDYIKDKSQRLNFYKRVAMANTAETIDNIRDELSDRFGPLTGEVENLLKIRELKVMLKDTGIRDFMRLKNKFFIGFDANDENGEKKDTVVKNITDLVKNDSVRYGFSAGGRFFAMFDQSGENIDKETEESHKQVIKEARYLLKQVTLGC